MRRGELEEIKDRVRGARDGDWVIKWRLNHYAVGPIGGDPECVCRRVHDAQFLKHARLDMLSLIEEVERLCGSMEREDGVGDDDGATAHRCESCGERHGGTPHLDDT